MLPLKNKEQDYKQSDLLGHLWVLQRLVSDVGPEHLLPPCAGAGLLQLRDRRWTPLPQDLEHRPYGLQGPYLPSTDEDTDKLVMSYTNAS